MNQKKYIDHEIFSSFARIKCIGDGQHVFDFLGSATNCSYKKGWDRFALEESVERAQSYPAKDEHYLDWIALLDSVSRAKGGFRMAELGAGWGPWLIRGYFACKQKNIPTENIELLGVEADPIHYKWMIQHFHRNGLEPTYFPLIEGAVSTQQGVLKFPVTNEPSVDYGSSLQNVNSSESGYTQVRAITLEEVLNNFSDAIDLIHMDIQGEEYSVLESSMNLVNSKVKSIMVGTHQSKEKHDWLVAFFKEQDCWEAKMLYPRASKVETEYGVIQFGDGFQYWTNKNLR